MEMRPCSVCVKKLIKVGLSVGGGVQLDFLLNRGVCLSWVLLRKKYCVRMRVLNVPQHLYISCLKVLVGVETGEN